MSTAPNAGTENTTQPPASPQGAPSTSQAAPGSTSPTAPSEWRAPATAAPYFAGKSAAEILGLAEQLAGALQGVVQTGVQPQTPATPQQQPQQPWSNQWGSSSPNVFSQYPSQQPAPQWNAEANPTFGDLQRVAPDLINQAVTPQFQNVDVRLSQLALDTVKRANAPIFEKYGPEIDAYLVKVPFNQRTVDNLQTIVQIVRGNHVEEIGREIAGRLVAEMEPQLRSNGSPSVPVAQAEPKNTLQSDAIPQDWKKRADQLGISESSIDEWCQSNRMTRDQFFAQFGATAITEVTRSD